jgi:hypothetical protein
MDIEAYIRQAAAARGIDPDIAVRVAKSEGGLKDPTRQSLVTKGGVREPSYGPFQLLVGGGDTGFPAGMGNDFVAKYGMHPSDPNAWQKGIDFALDNAANKGWGAWYGAAKVGVDRFDGIGGPRRVPGTSLAGAERQMGDQPMTASVPPLENRGDVKTYNVAEATEPSLSMGDKIGQAIWGDNAEKLKGLFGEGATANPASKGLNLLSGAMGKGSTAQAQEHAAPIQSSLPAIEAADAQRTMAAQQLMSTLLSTRKNRGTTIGRFA